MYGVFEDLDGIKSARMLVELRRGQLSVMEARVNDLSVTDILNAIWVDAWRQ
ncbi:MAG: hypothetical protein IPG26_02120 [Coprothermobacter sp.]|nr:hypothetical protein [Coprothermobacter sp.]